MTVSEGDSQALRTAIDTRVHDLVVTLDSIAKATSVPLFDETLYVVGPSRQFAPDAELTMEQVFDLPLIMPTRRHGIRILLERQALIFGREINIVREIEGVASTKAAIRAGLGLSVLGRGAVHADQKKGTLSAAALKRPDLTRRLVLDMPVNHPPTRAAIEVRKILLAVVRKLGAEGHWSCPPARN
ncbi:LysR substrate-binding domain-containing protein [Sinorhizobium meliloti]